MKKHLTIGSCVLACLTIWSFAADNNAPGTVRGVVTFADGKPAPSVQVKFERKIDRSGTAGAGGSGGADKAPRSAFNDDQSPVMLAGVSVVVVKTDAAGKYEAKNLMPGKFRYTAGNPKVGYKAEMIEVGSAASMELNIQLAKPAGAK